MKEQLEKNIEEIAGKAERAEKSEDAVRFAQAALNLAHVLSVQRNTELQR